MIFTAEFRGPGVRHHFDQDSPDEYGDLDMEHRSNRGFGGRGGRIILLGDGTEVLTDSDDIDMFDHAEADKDDHHDGKIEEIDSDEDVGRNEPEGTPGPQSASEKGLRLTESPSSTHTETSHGSGIELKGVSDGPVPKD